MNVAFYAPLKSPDSPVPSGDRLIGRMLLRAIEAGGHKVILASRLRAFDKAGETVRQARIARIGAWSAQRLLRRFQAQAARPDLWLTYHLYHKAPDWIGPVVTRALGIPYCVVEASSAARAAHGAWGQGHQAVAAALAEAALVIGINPKDEAGIRPLIGPWTRMVHIPPFIDGQPFRNARGSRTETRGRLARICSLDTQVPWLLAVGMLRPGDKAASYRVLAEALAKLGDRPWQLIIVGDGVARVEIEHVLAGSTDRVRFVGLRTANEVAGFMAASDLLVWPAVNEAIGMVFIEAAMAGLPAVGADRPGIAAVIDHGTSGLLVPERDATAFAEATAALLDDAALRRSMGVAAAQRAALQNDLWSAGAILCRELEATVR
jgi:glycosyltransferase involved in cell wall biosynthesis